ncbi:type II secretion system protein GspH [Oxalobacteraceae bacterium OM1]|nr:type II secretion system protein GspH [Oxalobacteraceae bacterium OM1]
MHRRARTRGFTLLELLVVLVIAGIMLGVVTLSGLPNARQAMQNDAQRIALLMQLARDEAIVRNRPVAFEAESDRYRFLIRDNDSWNPLGEDDMLREREFKNAPVVVSIAPNGVATQLNPLRIVFGREPVDKPFSLTLSSNDVSVVIRADGVGHFTVE